MKIRNKSILCGLLMIALLSACSSTTTNFEGIAMDEHQFRNSDMGNSVAQVMAAEKGIFSEEITADSEEGRNYFVEGTNGTVLSYTDTNVAGHNVRIMYVFLEEELIGAVMAFDALYSKQLYLQLSDYFLSKLPAPAENPPHSANIDIAESQFWEIDGVNFRLLLSGNNQVMIEVATTRYFDQLF